MAGLTELNASNIGRSAVDAFKAGNDLMLIPANLDASYQATFAGGTERRDPVGASRRVGPERA